MPIEVASSYTGVFCLITLTVCGQSISPCGPTGKSNFSQLPGPASAALVNMPNAIQIANHVEPNVMPVIFHLG